MRSCDGRIPLIVGVTGHRNPDPGWIAGLESRFESILSELHRAAPSTPIVLLTPLARGCDRIAARVGFRLREKWGAASVAVLGVLPLAVGDYRQDFAADAADAAEFEELLARCDDWFELPPPPGIARDANGFVPPGPGRDAQYRRLGLYVALQAQVLVAMWDGVRNNRVGGTAEVVDFCHGRRPNGSECAVPFRRSTFLLAPPDTTPIACIPTRREGAPEPAEAAVELARDGLPPRAIEQARDLDLLNRRLAATSPGAWRPRMVEVPVRGACAAPWNALVERFLRLDALGSAAKVEQRRSAIGIAGLAAAGVGAFQWFSSYAADLASHAWIAMVLYFGGFLAALALWFWSVKVRRTEWIFVHARAMAEAMRIQLAWIASDVFEVAPDLYLARRHGQVRFLRAQLRAAILECAIIASRGGVHAGIGPARLWIDEQIDYFDREGEPSRRRRRFVRWQGRVALLLRALVLLLSLLLLGVSVRESFGSAGEVGRWANLGCFVVGLSLACAVAFDYLKEAFLDQEELDVAARMLDVFAEAKRRLDDGTTPPHDVVRAIGKEALDEHADWFARHRDRLRLPEAG